MKKRETININDEQEERIMKGFVQITIISTMLFSAMLFGREKAGIHVDADASIVYDGREYVITESENQINSN
ncbi:MAG: hypothetical protein QF535_10630, partial [Anaerolineales bacterium]|nr:hypothetical protein [Anaerolineales bacterium]